MPVERPSRRIFLSQGFAEGHGKQELVSPMRSQPACRLGCFGSGCVLSAAW